MRALPTMNQEMKLPEWLQRLNYLTLSFRYTVKRDFEFNFFLGPEVRGSIGRQLKEEEGCFADHDADCQECPAVRLRDCIYRLCFEHGGNRRKAFILKLDPAYRSLRPHFERGVSFRFDLVLSGSLLPHAQTILTSLAKTRLRLGDRGFAPQLSDYGWLDEKHSFVSAIRSAVLPPSSGYAFLLPQGQTADSSAVLHFLTPAEITLKHGRLLKNPKDLNFRLLMVRIMQRLRGLADDLPGARSASESVDRQRENCFLSAAEAVNHCPDQARWQKISLRQTGKRRCGGLGGRITYRGELDCFLPFLEAVEIFGLGKSVTLGLGHVRFEK